MAIKALKDKGYDIVDFHITPSEYADARNYLLGTIINGTIPGVVKDFWNAGEDLTLGNWTSMFLLGRRKLGRFLIMKLMSAIGMGRHV